jgi:hypothetical protein
LRHTIISLSWRDKKITNQSIEAIVKTPVESGEVSLHSASSQTFDEIRIKTPKENDMTKQIVAALMTAITVATASMTAHAQEVSVETMPPSVIKTVPACGDTAVPASTKEIKVTFSKDMMTNQMWSWCFHSKDSFPEITDQKGIKYLQDGRTCVLPVKLEANKSYAIWINTQKFTAFQDKKGNSAVPYLLVFKTK